MDMVMYCLYSQDSGTYSEPMFANSPSIARSQIRLSVRDALDKDEVTSNWLEDLTFAIVGYFNNESGNVYNPDSIVHYDLEALVYDNEDIIVNVSDKEPEKKWSWKDAVNEF